MERSIDKEGSESIIGAINIAGNYVHDSGRTLDPKVARLKTGDSETEGLRLELHGGQSPFTKKGRNQQAVIEFICDHSRTGLETGYDKGENQRRDGEPNGDKGNQTEKDNTSSLRFKSYGAVDDLDVLRLDWLTKYACEDYEGDKDEGEKKGDNNHWGFFTWVIIL